MRQIRMLAALMALAAAACAQPMHHDPVAPGTLSFGERIDRDSALIKVVNKYFHYRKLAVVARDAEILWAHFPQLRTGEDMSTGINTEGWLAMRSDAGRSVIDVVYDLEGYEPVQVRRTGDESVVRIHGWERFIETDFTDGTAGEFIIDLYISRVGGEWIVTKTDELTLSEYHER